MTDAQKAGRAEREEVRFYKTLGASIREHRKALGITQEACAEAIGLTRTSVANIEKGRQRVLAHQIPALASVLQCSLLDLVNDLPPDSRMLQSEARRWRARALKMQGALRAISNRAAKFAGAQE